MESLSAVALLLFAAAFANGVPVPCKDQSTLCDLLVRYCGHSQHGEWMEVHCAAKCHFCEVKEVETTITTTAQPPPPPLPPTEEPVPVPVEPTEFHKKVIPGTCGVPQIKGSRVVGGKAAVRGSWPWQILLLYAGYPSCGGSLISAEWVVTASHCIFMMENYTNEFTIRTGEYDRRVLEGSEREYEVEKIIAHPNYDPYKLDSDIALIKLKTPVMFDKYRSPVCLPSRPPKVGQICYITGWGKMKYTEQMVDVLQQGKLPVASQETCQALNMKNIGIRVTKSMICGGSGGKTVLSGCHGDSGGPYVCQEDGRWVLQGAVSHGSPRCNSTETYTVFSRVTYFKSWIDMIMRTQ